MDIKSNYEHAQVAVLGSLMISPKEIAGDVMHRVSPDDFSNPTYRNIFSAIRDLFLARKPIDPVAISDRLGGGSYSNLLVDIMTVTPTAANYSEYVDILVKGHSLIELQVLGMELAGCRDLEEATGVLTKAEAILTARPNRRVSTYKEMISEYLDRQSDRSPPDYLDWGIDALNRNLAISPGRFVVLGADSSVGKTALAFQLAYNIASKGKRVAFFSYETSRQDAIDRILANTANVDLPLSKRKAITKDNVNAVITEGDKAEHMGLAVFETSGYTVEKLRVEMLAGHYDVVFIDYVQFIPSEDHGSRWEEVTGVSMALHTMAQQTGVTIVALSQVTPPETDKKGNRKQLTKHNLRESRQLINDADAILMMDLSDPKDYSSLRILAVEKNKDGPLGQIYLQFDPTHMRFTVAPPPKSETYRKIDKAVANAKREYREQKQAIDGQATFQELPDDAGGELPF